MTTDKQKSVRDYRGRFKKKRYASPGQSREIFDRMYEREERAREAASEAYLRTPEGEAERQERNRQTLERMRAERLTKNPKKTRKLRAKRVTRAKRNPTTRYTIEGQLQNGRMIYYRLSTSSFVSDKKHATNFKSRYTADKTARDILPYLDPKIEWIRVV